jgi:hypothetical protein
VFVSIQRPSMIEGAGDSAETHPANDFESVRSRRHNLQRPSVLRHLSSIHWTHPSSPEEIVSRLAKEAHRGLSNGVRATERLMLQSCGCYSASPCPLDTGLVRLIVYSAFRATPNALVRGETSLLFRGRGFVCRTRRVWIAGFT